MNELHYITVAEAAARKGMRVVFTAGLPAPWGLSTRAILEHKKIPFVAVAQIAGEPNAEVEAWCGHNSGPVVVLNNERPRALWSEILLLAERLAPEPRLIPEDAAARADMFGLAHEICGEDGLGWNARVLLFDAAEAAGANNFPTLVAKYSTGAPVEYARQRTNALINMLVQRLTDQAAAGSPYLVGNALSAADIYWCAFSIMFAAFPDGVFEMPDYYKLLGATTCSYLDAPLPAILIEHRDRIAGSILNTPMKF